MIESRLLVRDLTPCDAGGLTDFIASLPVEQLCQRFHNPSRTRALHHVEQMVAGLGSGHVLGVVAEDSGAVVGLADAHLTSAGAIAEFAVLVAERCQGRGIGSRLLRQLIAAAVDAGVTTLTALIQLDNSMVLEFAQRLHGARLRPVPGGLMELTIQVAASWGT